MASSALLTGFTSWSLAPPEAAVGIVRPPLPNPGEAHIRRAADKLEARWHVIETGHYPMLSTPDELTRIILNV